MRLTGYEPFLSLAAVDKEAKKEAVFSRVSLMKNESAGTRRLKSALPPKGREKTLISSSLYLRTMILGSTFFLFFKISIQTSQRCAFSFLAFPYTIYNSIDMVRFFVTICHFLSICKNLRCTKHFYNNQPDFFFRFSSFCLLYHLL